MSLGNREGEEDEDAEPEELPDWNAEIIPARDGKARLFYVFRMPFCALCKKVFLYDEGGMTVRKFLMCMLMAMTMLIVGCGGTDQPKNERAEKGEIVISVGKYMVGEGFDPTVGWGLWGPDPFHSALMMHDAKNQLVKDLATDVQRSADGLKYTFTIRSDAKFSDGQPLTAEDVAFTYETTKKAGSAVDLAVLESVRVLSPTQVEFTLSKPWSVFLETTASLGIVPKHVYKEGYATAPVGSGPWKVVSFQKEQQVIMEPNEYYYGEKPKLKKVTVLNLGDDAILAAAQSGQVDLVFTPPEFASASVPNMKLVLMDSIDSFCINMPQEPEHDENGMLIGNNVTSDPAIRTALNIGIDRRTIIENALAGFAKPTMNFAEALPWANNALQEKDNRVDEAVKILEDAGWKDTDGDGIREKNGVKAEFVINGRANDLQRYNTAVALAQDAKKLGINIIAKSTPWSEARKIARNIPTTWAFGDFTPQTIYNYFHSAQIGVNVINNPAIYRNPTVDAHIDRALAATSEEEALREFKAAQWDGTTGPKADIPYLWIATVQVPYLVNERLELGHLRVGERGQGMGILANLDEWQWK